MVIDFENSPLETLLCVLEAQETGKADLGLHTIQGDAGERAMLSP